MSRQPWEGKLIFASGLQELRNLVGLDWVKERLEAIISERQDEHEAERAVIDAAIAWWEFNRPLTWGARKHLAVPDVRLTGPKECELAHAVAALLKARGEGK